MAVDPSIGLQVQNTNPIAMIGGYLDLGQKQLQLDKSRQTFNADVAQRQAESSSAQSAATVNAANVQPLIAQQAAQTSGAQSAAGIAGVNNALAHLGAVSQSLGPLATDPDITPQKVTDAISKAHNVFGDGTPQDLAASIAAVPDTSKMAPADATKALQGFIRASQMRAQTAQTQLTMQNPAPTMMNNGQQVTPVAPGPANLTSVPAGTPQGTPTQLQAPPTTPVMRGGVPGLLGPQAPTPTPTVPTPPASIQTGPAIGQVEGTTGPIATNNAHYANVQAAAQDAPTRIGVLQNIKQLAPGAVTGDQATVKNFVSKVAGYFGVDAATAAQTNTDVLAKETALLASKAGNTDLALTLNQAATPNGHMQLGAINQTVDQLIGQEKAKVAAQQYFQGTPTNSPLYPQKMAAWSQNGDPQAFEYASKSPADQATMKAAMVKAGTWGALRQHMIQLHVMGLDPQ